MFTLPSNATDDELRAAVLTWFNLLASGNVAAAQDFLDTGPNSLPVTEFMARVEQLTAGGMVTTAERIEIEWDDVDDLPVFPDGSPIDTVCRWIPGPKTTDKHPGFIGDILATVPVNGAWSGIDASFFIRESEGRLSIQLRDVIRFEDTGEE
jgi:hypothetical protein